MTEKAFTIGFEHQWNKEPVLFKSVIIIVILENYANIKEKI